MSRARPIHTPDQTIWFDTLRNSRKATEEQLELLAMIKEIDLDDLLDDPMTQGEVIAKLREALGQGGIPRVVIERRERWREARSHEPACRVCGKKGDSTKHHFVPRWILRELDGYHHKWADRRKNCIPLCIACHRDLHSRANGPHSIVEYLTDEEKRFTDRALTAFVDERPAIAWLVIRGEPSVYECQLMLDWIQHKFEVSSSVADPASYGHHMAMARRKVLAA